MRQGSLDTDARSCIASLAFAYLFETDREEWLPALETHVFHEVAPGFSNHARDVLPAACDKAHL